MEVLDVRDEIVTRVDQLSLEMQPEVLRFVETLAEFPKGEKGKALRRFAGSLDPASAREMMRAVEEECERWMQVSGR